MGSLFAIITTFFFFAAIISLFKPNLILKNSSRKKSFLIFMGLSVLFFILTGAVAPKIVKESKTVSLPTPSQQIKVPTKIPTPTKKKETKKEKISELNELGQEGFLRIAGDNDSTQIIPLAPTEEVYSQITKALMAKDYEGLLELTTKGVFAVSNGTKVRLIDTAVGLRKVRILKGVRPIDQDKIGLSGWVAKEFTFTR